MTLSKKVVTTLFLSIIVTTISFAQTTPAKYICDKVDGELTKFTEERSFVGDTYKCSVKEQWDMMIMSE
ncbi:hypothetical protein ACKGJO_05310 [Gracilimonas sp. Q87]|uniref:hypothetical protein n=1 Tax=Gracilimonas sp. Q87 TaxID=3384766 RepID=UPI00398425F1